MPFETGADWVKHFRARLEDNDKPWRLVYAGTSGFAYAAWKPDFDPGELLVKQFLKHYATRLRAVEINYTFRRLPAATTLAAWVEAKPSCHRSQ